MSHNQISPVQMKGTKFSLILCLVCYTTRDGSFYSLSSPKVNVLKLSGLFESHNEGCSVIIETFFLILSVKKINSWNLTKT